MRGAALLLVALVAACGTVHRLDFSMDPRQTATVVVTGRQSNVVVRNAGPGVVTVIWPDGSRSEVGSSGAMRYVRGTARIRLQTGDGSANLHVEAHQGTGISLTASPPVPTRPTGNP